MMLRIRKSGLAVVVAFCLGGSTQLQAQSMTVLGASEDARNCSMEAEMASHSRLQTRKGLESCTRALEYGHLTKRDRAATMVNRGIVLTAAREYAEALDDYNHALELQPTLAEPYVGRGNLVFMAGRFDLAIDEYNKALDKDLSRRHVGYFNRGLAYEQQGLLAEAAADYQRAQQISPEWTLPREKLEQLAQKEKAEP